MFIADIAEWLPVIERIGVPLSMLLFILFAGFKRWWVWGYQLKDAEKREADWKDMALRGTLIAERSSGREKWSVEQRLDYLEGLTKGRDQG